VTCVTVLKCIVVPYCLDLPSKIFNCTIIIAESSGKLSMRLKRRPKFATDQIRKQRKIVVVQLGEVKIPLHSEEGKRLHYATSCLFLVGFLESVLLVFKRMKDQSIHSSK
jgi:hypothetical protein